MKPRRALRPASPSIAGEQPHEVPAEEYAAPRRPDAGRPESSASLEPWTTLGISRRDWYAHRARYRDRYRLSR